ncbi:MAG: tRNA (N(6)-L-threonylcarbamoyladenosine(37)-C(2))-methylthiotransferase MtaB [Candidatus Hydromicrobium sp.]
MKFSVDTLGCKINQSESDFIVKELLEKGLELVSWSKHPDFCIINTCTVTSRSDRKARQIIRKIKSQNKNSKIIVTGCFVVFNKKFLQDCGIDFIVENKDKNKILDLIGRMTAGRKDLEMESFDFKSCPQFNRMHSRPLVKIQDGCEQNCTYCIVPKVRGKYKSIPYREILNKIIDLQKDGFEEVVLTGIHIGKYGVDFSTGGLSKGSKISNLANLLEEVVRETSIKRIRISSIEVNEIDSRLLDILKRNNGRFASHLHIPLQSGSDRILKLMGRPYTAEYYFRKIGMISGIFPDIALTTDVMAGFPGESEEDFARMVNMIERIAFSKIHVFKFSKRMHTPAYGMGNQVGEEIKSERSKILRDIGDRLRNSYIKNHIGKLLNVVCEEMNVENNIISGTSENYIKVYFPMDKENFPSLKGKILRVVVNSEYKNGLWGILS